MPEVIKVLLFSIGSIAFLFVLSKLLGKKQVAQLTFVDYVIGISLGSIAAEVATDTETPFYYYLIAMAIFFIFAILLSIVGRLTPWLKHILKGKPSTLIYNGKVQYNQLKRSHLDINDLLALCRERGYFDINNIAYAILETNGQLSVMPVGSEKPVVVSNFDIEVEQASLTNYLIVDGRVSFSGLSEINKDCNWLYKNLNINSKEDINQIILASYNEKLKKFDVHYKDPKINKNINQIKSNQQK